MCNFRYLSYASSLENVFPVDDVDTVHASLAKTNVCSQEQSFLTLAKETQSPLGLYWNPLTFFFYKSSFCAPIHDQHLVLFSLHHTSAFVMNHRRLHYAYVIRQKWEKGVFYRFKYGYLSSIRYKRPLFIPWSRMMHVLIWMDANRLSALKLYGHVLLKTRVTN